MAEVDIKIDIQAKKAEATLARLNSSLKITAEREKQAALKTQLLEQRLLKTGTAAKTASKGFSVASVAVASFIGNITSRAVSSGISTIINGFKSVVDNGRAFESALVQISKTTGLSSKDTAKLGKEIQSITRDLPIATSELLDIAKVAGQLGISSTKDIRAFTETIGKLQLATDIAGEEGSQDIARILTITGELQKNGSENINKFGNVITQLGNNFAATEAQILQVANEVAKGTTIFGVSSEDVLGLATAFKVTGSEAEISGSTIQKVFADIGSATKEGGDKLTKFAEASGLTEKAFTELFRSDPTTAFLKLTEGLGKAGLSGADLTEKLKELGFADRRVVKSLAPLITQHEVLSDAIRQARLESESLTALNEETRKAQNTLDSDLQKLNNSWNELSTVLFGRVGPALREIAQDTTALIKKMKQLAEGDLKQLPALFGTVYNEILRLSPQTRFLADMNDKLVKTYKELNSTQEQTIKNADSLAEGYKNADGRGRDFIDGLSGTVTGLEQVEIPLKKTKKLLEEINTPLLKAGESFDKLATASGESAQRVLIFEQEKTKNLKRFFTEQEIAKIESNFKLLKADKDRASEAAALQKAVIAEGERREAEAANKILGRDKATIESARKKQEQLRKFAEQDRQLKQEQQLIADQDRMLILENDGIFNDARLIAVQEFFTKAEELKIQANIDAAESERARQNAILTAQVEGQQRRLNAKLELESDLRNVERDSQKIIIEDNKQLKELESKADRERVSNRRDALSTMATLQRSNSKELAFIGKAAGITQIALDTPQAISKALAAFPPPFNFIAAAGVGAAMAIQAKQIASVNVGGFEQGGIVPGASFTGDNVNAKVNSGEMILNRSQQNQLFKMANGGQGQGGQQEIVVHTKVQIDEETIATAVSRQVANGLQLGEVQ